MSRRSGSERNAARFLTALSRVFLSAEELLDRRPGVKIIYLQMQDTFQEVVFAKLKRMMT
jgi:hypothetical protein